MLLSELLLLPAVAAVCHRTRRVAPLEGSQLREILLEGPGCAALSSAS
jgi:hypothetical protein